MGEWINRGHNCSSFFQENDKAQGGSSKIHTSHKVGHKRVLASLNQPDNSRCHHTRFKVNSSHKALTPISNKTPHFLASVQCSSQETHSITGYRSVCWGISDRGHILVFDISVWGNINIGPTGAYPRASATSSIVLYPVASRGISELVGTSLPKTLGTSTDSNITPCPHSQISTLAMRASMEDRRGVKVAKMALSIIQGTSASNREARI
ncbi:hypothetical protein H5410_022444 [Solanum commersonii]|uniref:Uncharacterized protein n=1 Tax=Solanum commersonii TaxID=4109 RepID=A0A9J5ZE04_SOLCO|nr:hypothetical protein H5410_022444 [Solanum commersonii]